MLDLPEDVENYDYDLKYADKKREDGGHDESASKELKKELAALDVKPSTSKDSEAKPVAGPSDGKKTIDFPDDAFLMVTQVWNED